LISGRIVVHHSGAEIFHKLPTINEKGRASKNEVLPLLQAGSQNWSERRTFSFVVILKPELRKIVKSQQTYRNPINLAKEYKEVIKSGQARNEADLARNIGVSRVTVNHFISLLKLTPEVIQAIENIGDPMPKRYITERRLRSIIKLPREKQIVVVGGFIR
jgi:hypothetical protein